MALGFAGEVIHDWNFLLGRMELLSADKTIAFLFRAAGVLSMLVCLVGGAWILWLMFRLPKRELEPSAGEGY